MATDQGVPSVCGICGKALSLEKCKIDEHGQAVHEECSVEALIAAHEIRLQIGNHQG
jgi:hypothetical protein